MADSISYSWAAESDLPSGENVCHRGRDYIPEFTTDQASICYFLFHQTIIVSSYYQFIKSRPDNVVLMHICYFLLIAF